MKYYSLKLSRQARGFFNIPPCLSYSKMTNIEKMKEAVEMLLSIKRHFDLTSSDDVLLDCAVRIYNTENIGENGHEPKVNAPAKDGSWRNEPMKEGQINFFVKRKIQFKAEMKRGEASDMIDNIIKQGGGRYK